MHYARGSGRVVRSSPALPQHVARAHHRLEGVNHIWRGAKALLHIFLSFTINTNACFHGAPFCKLNNIAESSAPAWSCLRKNCWMQP